MRTRREFLFSGISLPALLAAAGSGGRAKNCIIYFQEGGACQHDSFDPKPEQPLEIRGVHKTIPTAIPGVHFSELLPRCARMADRFTVIRSMYSREAIHEKAKQYIFSGSRPNNAFKHPVIGSVVAKELGPRGGLPAFVCIPRRDISADAGFLGSAYDPFITGDPGRKEFRVQDLALPANVTLEEAAGRANLLRALDEEVRQVERTKLVEGMDSFTQKAFELVSSAEARKAFNLDEEPAALRDRYGRNSTGQGALLARRLVEAGVRLAAVFQGGYDAHGNIEKSSNTIFPIFDQAFSALLEDLGQRGLLDSTLVLAIGEFGRTPHINHSAGRDHWPGVFSIAVAGAGIPPGQVIGSSDAQGGAPKERPISIEDLGATVYRKLGIDVHKEYHSNGRPVKMNDGGTPIRELF
ncbi:MAG: DUF1501 domain-containing protein [Acidobacteria bacterium]|jgi:hypothetical protein|nr:DUF1501 domain-containing protein [Bryobacteraceae bacterium CoA2 C42]MCA2962546.1 DUF1501 domain-containing protein [Acidobacteriaceae bacterium]